MRVQASVSYALALVPVLIAAFPVWGQWSTLDVGGEAVAIFRDDYGAPHIAAQTLGGMYHALGYVVAQDRLTQLENSRRYGKGALAELYGIDYGWVDFLMRRDYYTDAERQAQFDALSPETQAVFQHYADGVNAWIAEAYSDPEQKLPYELWEAGIALAPWSVLDSVAAAQVILRRFGERGGHEMENQLRLEAMGREAFDAQFPLNNPEAPTTIPPEEGGAAPHHTGGGAGPTPGLPKQTTPRPQGNRAVADQRNREAELLLWAAQAVGFTPRLGSYGAVVGTGRATPDTGLLLACPSMHFCQPPPPPQCAVEVDLHGPGIDVAGVTFAGVPCVFLAHTNTIAWTMTSGRSDNTDLYVEQLNPENPQEYWYEGCWHTMEARELTIVVNGADTIQETVYRTVHGPVFDIDEEKHLAYTYKRTFWDREMDGIEAVLAMSKAATPEAWLEAVTLIPVSLNALYADIHGNIAYAHAGRFRIVAEGVDPRLPVYGTGEEEWQRLLDFSELPQIVNPAQGYLANFNNKPVAWWDNGDIGWWESTHHATALFDAIKASDGVGFAELAAVPESIDGHGSYEHVVEMTPPFRTAENILPPGQSGFINLSGTPSPHYDDQTALYNAWMRKPFGYLFDSDGDRLFDQAEEFLGTQENVPDSDGDGLADGDEVRDLDLETPDRQNPFDPRQADSTGDDYTLGPDGVEDGLNDWDGDGVANADEFARGTNAILPEGETVPTPVCGRWVGTRGCNPLSCGQLVVVVFTALALWGFRRREDPR